LVENKSNGIKLKHAPGEPAWSRARRADSWKRPGLNRVKPGAGLGEPVSAAIDDGPADAAKYQKIPIAEPAAAGPI
jgi:hypothetical protein